MNMIRNVIFDLGGVLLNLDLQRCFKGFEALGVDMEMMMKSGRGDGGATMCEGVSATGDMDLYQVGGIGTEEFLERMRRLCKEGTRREDVLRVWNSWLLDIPLEKLELLKRLRREGYGVYMLSNTNEAHWEHIVRENFPEPVDVYFDDVFMSQELGMAKPNACIYKEVLRRIGCEAEQCLFIDDARANCDAAEVLGMKAVKYEVGVSELEDLVYGFIGL